MAKSKAEVNFMEHLKPLLPAGGDASELEAAAQALAGLSPEDRDLLAAVQESPYPGHWSDFRLSSREGRTL